MKSFDLHNGVNVYVSGGPASEGPAPIAFDLRSTNEDHTNVGSGTQKVYQNITVEEAKRIRKALKAAIKESEGK